MDNLVAQHPGLVSKVNIGYSFENRPMDVLKKEFVKTERERKKKECHNSQLNLEMYG